MIRDFEMKDYFGNQEIRLRGGNNSVEAKGKKEDLLLQELGKHSKESLP
jgi:hypothetical protein